MPELLLVRNRLLYKFLAFYKDNYNREILTNECNTLFERNGYGGKI